MLGLLGPDTEAPPGGPLRSSWDATFRRLTPNQPISTVVRRPEPVLPWRRVPRPMGRGGLRATDSLQVFCLVSRLLCVTTQTHTQNIYFSFDPPTDITDMKWNQCTDKNKRLQHFRFPRWEVNMLFADRDPELRKYKWKPLHSVCRYYHDNSFLLESRILLMVCLNSCCEGVAIIAIIWWYNILLTIFNVVPVWKPRSSGAFTIYT